MFIFRTTLFGRRPPGDLRQGVVLFFHGTVIFDGKSRWLAFWLSEYACSRGPRPHTGVSCAVGQHSHLPSGRRIECFGWLRSYEFASWVSDRCRWSLPFEHAPRFSAGASLRGLDDHESTPQSDRSSSLTKARSTRHGGEPPADCGDWTPMRITSPDRNMGEALAARHMDRLAQQA